MDKSIPWVTVWYHLSCDVRKPDFCICENKDADQLRRNYEADQRLCFHYTVQSLYFLNTKFQPSNHLMRLYSPVSVGTVENPEDRFSHKKAHLAGTEMCLCGQPHKNI